MPLSFYAAHRLMSSGGSVAAVLELVDRESREPRWLAPTAAYLLRDVSTKLVEAALEAGASDLAGRARAAISSHIRDIEQALALRKDLPILGLSRPAGGSDAEGDEAWVLYGDEPWLVRLAPSVGDIPPTAVAVRAEQALRRVARSVSVPSGAVEVSLTTPGDGGGESLGPGLLGMRVRLAPPAEEEVLRAASRRRAFYGVTLLLALSVALLGAYLLWRDVQRELSLAELRSQFVSGVTHELRTPLTSIRMFAETLLHRRPEDVRIQDEFLETITSESDRLSRLLGNVLDFSKIERGVREYHREPSALVDIVQAAVRAMRYPLEQESFELNVDLEDDVPQVSVDADAVEQAVLNLLANAMKYSGESRKIDLRLSQQNGHAVIDVLDQGIGIEPDEQKRIFERFYRVAAPDLERIPGTGLGLALVDHVAKGHGGFVALQSAPGEGSTFSLHLPLSVEE